MTFTDLMSDVADGFELLGAAVLVGGFAAAFVQAGIAVARRKPTPETYRQFRSFAGRTILLGLEVLVAADLIRTVAVDQSWESVGVLATIVLIRTFLSFTLEIEIDGRLPWRSRSGAHPDRSDGASV